VKKLLFFSLLLGSCVAGAQVPKVKHVVVIVEENHSFESVIGNSQMPFLNHLAHTYAYTSQYFANTHPSLPNYFQLTTGQFITTNDNFNGVTTADNVVRELDRFGLTWDDYAESIPFAGYTGKSVGQYLKRHNPFAFFSDVVTTPAQRSKMLGVPDFSEDLSANVLPNFAFVVPNRCDDAHDCSLGAADRWLRSQVSGLLTNPDFAKSGLLFIVFDEGAFSDHRHGGGRVATVVAGTHVKRGFVSARFYQHQNLLRTALQALGASRFPGASANAAPMSDLFQ
jgi:acid phosphatase